MVIRKKFTLLLLTMAITPALLIIALYQSSFLIAEKGIKSKFQTIIDQKAKQAIQQQLKDFSNLLLTQNLYIDEMLSFMNSKLESSYYTTATETIFPENIIYSPGENTLKNLQEEKCLLSLISQDISTHAKDNIVQSFITIFPDGSAIVRTDKNTSITKESIANLRETNWYKKTIANNGLITKSHSYDLSGNKHVFIASQTCRDSNKQIIGVSAIEVSIERIFDGLTINKEWGANCQKSIITLSDGSVMPPDILVAFTGDNSKTNPAEPEGYITLKELYNLDSQLENKIAADLRTGTSNVQRGLCSNDDSLLIYSLAANNQYAALLVIPYENIISTANLIHQELTQHGNRQFFIGMSVIIATIFSASVLAVMRARNITSPIKDLTIAAQNIIHGRYDTMVNIRTGDEIETLGNSFNMIGPHLAERKSMLEALELAKSIQGNLLPGKNPDFPGYDIGGMCCYCDQTGGDYYDFILAGDNNEKLLAVLGDVAGHGIPAALLMASARATLRSLVTYCCSSLAELLEKFNNHFLQDTDGTRFITLFTCVIDNSNDNLHWASAGHDPALFFQMETKQITELPNTGMIAGIIDNTKYQQSGPVKINNGDIILIGTDGIWETRNQYGILFGRDKLKDIVVSNHHLTAEEMIQHILNEVKDFAGPTPISDDITMIVIKKKNHSFNY